MAVGSSRALCIHCPQNNEQSSYVRDEKVYEHEKSWTEPVEIPVRYVVSYLEVNPCLAKIPKVLVDQA